MHILVSNDDGPPSNTSSPYVHSLVSTLQEAGHTVSVVLPHTQRSWIGKAHMVGQMLTTTYFRPGNVLTDDGIIQDHPFNDGKEEWILVDGTPASCVQLGLYHFFKEKGPVDLVVSGPNYGRNTTAIFALSSGTIGGAMEGAMNGYKSVALSYAFNSRVHDANVISQASQLSTKLLEKFMAEWPEDVHLYSINVPLEEGVSNTKIVYTEMLQNKWTGSSFEEISEGEGDADPSQEEQKIRDRSDSWSEGNAEVKRPVIERRRTRFKWAPKFDDVRASVEKAGAAAPEPQRVDGYAVIQKYVSVTPLKANFWHVPKYTGEIKLQTGKSMSIPFRPKPQKSTIVKPIFHAVVNYPDQYVQPLICRALNALQRLPCEIVSSTTQVRDKNAPLLQYAAYESLDFEHAMAHPQSSLVSAYVIRKALIRKHYLSNTISTWLVKHPESILKKSFGACEHFELDYAEFLDDALVDAWDLKASMARNMEQKEPSRKEWWILKPGMSDGGNGVRLFSSLEDLQEIFEEWDEDTDFVPDSDEDDEDDEDDDDNEDDDDDDDEGDTDTAINGDEVDQEANSQDESLNEDEDEVGAMTSQLRHFIVQPYIDRPMLLASMDNRKYHIRAYVLAVGALRVYVYREMLALFAARPYSPPWEVEDINAGGLASQLTNTCFQDESTRESSVRRFWALQDETVPSGWQEKVFSQICDVTGEVFEAASREQMVHFQTLPNAFEVFGADFLVDEQFNVWLLELNAYPDFKQTGQDLQDQVVGGLLEEVATVAIAPFFDGNGRSPGSDRMVLVKSIELGRG